MTESDAFECFGNSDDDSLSYEDNLTGETQSGSLEGPQSKGRVLREQNNQRRFVAERMRCALPIDSPDFEVFETANNRGIGVRALRKYGIGDEIMREHAVMRVPNQQVAASEEEANEKHSQAIQRAFEVLSPETQTAVLDLSNSCNSGATEVGVYQTNSFLLGSGDDNDFDHNNSGLFLTVARINHSCRPNVLHFWRPDLQQTFIHAVHEIEIGEEMLTCYGPSECQATRQRQDYLQDRLLFLCQCNMCLEGNTNGSDDRMKAINNLQNEIKDQLALIGNMEADVDATVNHIVECVESCRRLLQDQGIGVASGTLKSILRCGYQAVCLMKEDDEKLALSYLRDLHTATLVGEGKGSPNYLEIEDMMNMK